MHTSTPSGLDLQAVRRRLGTRAIGLDLADAFERWRAEARGGDAEAFVQWILSIQAEEQVMVTAVLPPRFATTRVPTVSMDPTLILDPAVAVDATVIAPALDPTLIGEASVITMPAAPP